MAAKSALVATWYFQCVSLVGSNTAALSRVHAAAQLSIRGPHEVDEEGRENGHQDRTGGSAESLWQDLAELSSRTWEEHRCNWRMSTWRPSANGPVGWIGRVMIKYFGSACPETGMVENSVEVLPV